MEKVIEKHLSITSANRGIEKLDHEIYSHDKGTAVFKFTTDELTASKVLCLFYFKETKRYRTVEATISENTITVPFDSTSIITDEPVIGYVYFEKVEQSTDVYAFAFNVWVSAIDKAKKTPLIERTTGRIMDVENIVTKQELANKGYLTEHQSLTEYAKKSELPQPYNDTEVKARIQTLETKAGTLATKDELNRVGTPQQLSINGNVVTLSDGGGSITLPTTATTPSGNTGQSNEYEIRGTGFPNGKVTAPVGTTYVDTAVTNGALKWIKRKGDNNQGWEVLTGDTGWKRLSISSGYQQSNLRVRRINNMVTYKLDGLSQDRFGVVRRGGPGYLAHASDLERNLYILYNNRIPTGYRSAISLSGQIFDGTGNPYGTWFLGGINNGNYFMFHFTESVPTDNNITDIIVSNVSYITDDPWPTV